MKNKIKLVKDCLTNKDYGRNKARANARYEHKAGRRNYNAQNWKDLCTIESVKVAE